MTAANGGADGHRMPVRVYYEDTDAGGVVYYANYLRYAERARSELLRAVGFENAAMMADAGLALAVRRVNAEYLRPARLDDLLTVETSVTAVKGASLDMRQVISRDAETLVEMDLTIACITLDGRAARLPKDLRERIAQYRGE